MLSAFLNPQNEPLPAPAAGFVCGVARGAKASCLLISAPLLPPGQAHFKKKKSNKDRIFPSRGAKYPQASRNRYWHRCPTRNRARSGPGNPPIFTGPTGRRTARPDRPARKSRIPTSASILKRGVLFTANLWQSLNEGISEFVAQLKRCDQLFSQS